VAQTQTLSRFPQNWHVGREEVWSVALEAHCWTRKPEELILHQTTFDVLAPFQLAYETLLD
jgi:hypothetical protein